MGWSTHHGRLGTALDLSFNDSSHHCLPVQVCDETLGALAYMLKRNEQLPPGPIFTARLEVDYKKVGVFWILGLNVMMPAAAALGRLVASGAGSIATSRLGGSTCSALYLLLLVVAMQPAWFQPGSHGQQPARAAVHAASCGAMTDRAPFAS